MDSNSLLSEHWRYKRPYDRGRLCCIRSNLLVTVSFQCPSLLTLLTYGNSHCNVDRLTAMYQAIWPGEFIGTVPAAPSFGRIVRPGDTDDVNTPLRPFRHADGRDWTSADASGATSIMNYGYTYPEIPVEYRTRPAQDLTTYVTGRVNDLYRPALSGGSTGPSPGTGSGTRPSPGTGSGTGNGTNTGSGNYKSRREWIALVQVDQGEMYGQFSILVFIGDVPTTVTDWQTTPSQVGGCATFGEEQSRDEHIIRGTVPLTEALVDKKVDVNDPSSCVPYLRKNLKWVIKQVCSHTHS